MWGRADLQMIPMLVSVLYPIHPYKIYEFTVPVRFLVLIAIGSNATVLHQF